MLFYLPTIPFILGKPPLRLEYMKPPQLPQLNFLLRVNPSVFVRWRVAACLNLVTLSTAALSILRSCLLSTSVLSCTVNIQRLWLPCKSAHLLELCSSPGQTRATQSHSQHAATPFLSPYHSPCITVPPTSPFLPRHHFARLTIPPITIPPTSPSLPPHHSSHLTIPLTSTFLPPHHLHHYRVPSAFPTEGKTRNRKRLSRFLHREFCNHFYLPRGPLFSLFCRVNSSSLRLCLGSHLL